MAKCKNAIVQAQEKVYQVIDKCLDQYYGEFKPDEYIRTQKLLNSLVKSDIKTVGNGFEVEVYFDEKQLDYQTGIIPTQHGTGYATWGAEEVLDTAMHGSHGGYVAGTAIWEVSQAVLGDIYTLLRNELIAQGIPLKRG